MGVAQPGWESMRPWLRRVEPAANLRQAGEEVLTPGHEDGSQSEDEQQPQHRRTDPDADTAIRWKRHFLVRRHDCHYLVQANCLGEVPQSLFYGLPPACP